MFSPHIHIFIREKRTNCTSEYESNQLIKTGKYYEIMYIFRES